MNEDDPHSVELRTWAEGLAYSIHEHYLRRPPPGGRKLDIARTIERAACRLLERRPVLGRSVDDLTLDRLRVSLDSEAARLPMGGQFQHLRHEASRELQQGIDALTMENARLQARVNYLVACGYDGAIAARRAAKPRSSWWRHLLRKKAP